MATTSDLPRLSAGILSAEIVPHIGGSLASFRRAGVDIFRPLTASARAARDVLGVAMFPMMPYANRIAGNAFVFAGKTYRVAANNPPELFNVHGSGWRLPWRVEDATPEAARISLQVDDGAPYRYRAEQLFEIDPNGLTVKLSLRNLADETMPFGFGLHPWFPRDPDTSLTFTARRFYPEGPDMTSGDPEPVPAHFDFTHPACLPDRWCNNDFGGWTGVAEMQFPARGHRLRIIAPSMFGHLMFYADPARDVFCLEPQTNAAGAFNRPGGIDDDGEGVTILEPGAQMRAKLRFEVEPL